MTPSRTLPALLDARLETSSSLRLEKTRAAAAKARDALLADGPPVFVKEARLITLPYPSAYAFTDFASSPAPFILFTTKMHVVRFVDAEGATRTLVFNPVDRDRDDKAPFYVGLRKQFGETATKLMATFHDTVPGALEKMGIKPEDVDYVAFDHLHVRDVRRWLGTAGDDGEPAFFPRAKLLVHRAEWAAAKSPHPLEVPWYVPRSVDGVDEAKVVFFDDDVWLGKGAALVLTPGHTHGNMSLAVVTKRGVGVVSENGVATECYVPAKSRVAGVRKSAERMGQEVVLNGNTRVGSLEQYTSMVLEKTLAMPVDGDDIPLFFPSSELASHPLAPLLGPTFSLGALVVE